MVVHGVPEGGHDAVRGRAHSAEPQGSPSQEVGFELNVPAEEVVVRATYGPQNGGEYLFECERVAQ